MAARFPGCPFGTCYCAARMMQSGATEADITSDNVSEQVLLAGIGFKSINDHGVMMLDLGDGSLIIIDSGGKMSDEAMASQADIVELHELHSLTMHTMIMFPIAGQLDLLMLNYVAQELLSADFDAARLFASQRICEHA